METTLQGIKKQSILGGWISRIMSNKRPEPALVHPCIIAGEHTLVHENGLQVNDPIAYQQIVKFAKVNGFKLKEDQRADFIAGVKRVKNKRHANVVTIMALTATLLSTSVSAKSAADTLDSHVSSEVTQPYSVDGLDLNIDGDLTDDELAAGLLGWINSHSSFQHNLDKMPKIVKVSAVDMAHVAFGDALPAALDPEKLQIYGLYNFNEEAVYILDSLNLETDEGRGVLLHELVHFLQYQYDQDEDVKCKNELESLAYLLEAKFLESRDHEHKISMSHINKVSQCS